MEKPYKGKFMKVKYLDRKSIAKILKVTGSFMLNLIGTLLESTDHNIDWIMKVVNYALKTSKQEFFMDYNLKTKKIYVLCEGEIEGVGHEQWNGVEIQYAGVSFCLTTDIFKIVYDSKITDKKLFIAIKKQKEIKDKQKYIWGDK